MVVASQIPPSFKAVDVIEVLSSQYKRKIQNLVQKIFIKSLFLKKLDGKRLS